MSRNVFPSSSRTAPASDATCVFLLDTSVAIALRDMDVRVDARSAELGENVALSSITIVELEGGVHRDPTQSERRRALLDELVDGVRIIPFDVREASAYGRIVKSCGFLRVKVIDRMIAATAIAHGATLVTLNGKDFTDIPGLRLEAWA
jgi:tRNA(fMet)-specific endonuclease VapC